MMNEDEAIAAAKRAFDNAFCSGLTMHRSVEEAVINYKAYLSTSKPVDCREALESDDFIGVEESEHIIAGILQQREISVDGLTFSQQDIDNLVTVYNQENFTTPIQESLFRTIKICKQRLRTTEPVEYAGFDSLGPEGQGAYHIGYNRGLADATPEPVIVDLEAGAKALWQGSTPWEECTQEHRDYWRSQAKACVKAWGLLWK